MNDSEAILGPLRQRVESIFLRQEIFDQLIRHVRLSIWMKIIGYAAPASKLPFTPALILVVAPFAGVFITIFAKPPYSP
jgi:hypothetical protein